MSCIKLFTDQLIYFTLPPFCSSNLRVCILRTVLSLLLQYLTTFKGRFMNKYSDSCRNIFTWSARDNSYDVGRTRVPIIWIIRVVVSATIINRRAHQAWLWDFTMLGRIAALLRCVLAFVGTAALEFAIWEVCFTIVRFIYAWKEKHNQGHGRNSVVERLCLHKMSTNTHGCSNSK